MGMKFRWILPVACSLVTSIASAGPNALKLATLEYPPFIYQENDEAKGPLVETVKELFRRLEFEIDIHFYPVPRGLLMVSEGDVDAYFTLKRNEEREKSLLFTRTPLITQNFVFFAKADSDIRWDGAFADVRAYRIGVASQTSYGKRFDDAVKKGELGVLEAAGSFEQNFRKLIAGRVDLIVNSYDVGMAILKRLGAEQEVEVLSPPIESVPSYLAFTRKKDYADLASRYDRALDQLNEERKSAAARE
jgi:polar amino acid transport system substrate-binding protein